VQSTGPLGWGLEVVLKTPPRKKFLVTKPHIKDCRTELWKDKGEWKRICEAANVLQELWGHERGGVSYETACYYSVGLFSRLIFRTPEINTNT
jgi:hypothetical protein